MNLDFKCYLLSLLLCAVAAPWVARAQAPISNASTVEERLAQLERTSDVHSQLLTQLQQQLSESLLDIDNLRGQIQKNQYQLNQLNGSPKQPEQPHQQREPAALSVEAVPATQNTEIMNTPDASVIEPMANTADAIGNNSEKGDYDAAFDLVREKQDDQAIIAFNTFLTAYPKSRYQANANYWLGQLYYNKGQKDDALRHYARVVKSDAKSEKSPDALLKVGKILEEKKDNGKAKGVYQKIIAEYANSTVAEQAGERLRVLK
ncbi:tol-pal system protein YbgF [Candidatus Regiella insecticola 5.15]|uniref:Cell division coordinator CpoB n=1 Tax=Candidatus Regiella insecticola 5.15 TaxID=1005043 RepID=G2H006_9ENTR|nr:tol-pal system protein YbgF [Candidatus Regiella insecticola]EGY28670.1 tol-pal system protein YbgF [Candidatus Regiella insecticola 5.15]